MKLAMHLNTDGTGNWTKTVKSVYVKEVVLDDEGDYPQMFVYFDLKTWNSDKDGLIYTDPGFLKELSSVLKSKGLVIQPGDLVYSEQGLQGDNYVHLDVSDTFAKRWNKFASK